MPFMVGSAQFIICEYFLKEQGGKRFVAIIINNHLISLLSFHFRLFTQVSDKLFDEINWLTVHSLKAVSVSQFNLKMSILSEIAFKKAIFNTCSYCMPIPM
jgi:hypothetical protein